MNILPALTVSCLDCRLTLKEGQSGTQAEMHPECRKASRMYKETYLSDHISPTPSIHTHDRKTEQKFARTGDAVVDFFLPFLSLILTPGVSLERKKKKKIKKIWNFASVRFHFICYILNKSAYFYHKKITLPY